MLTRLELYFQQTIPILSHYESSGVVHKIQANRPKEEVSAQVREVM